MSPEIEDPLQLYFFKVLDYHFEVHHVAARRPTKVMERLPSAINECDCCLQTMRRLGPSIYDVRKILGFFYPLPLVTVTFTQPSLPSFLESEV